MYTLIIAEATLQLDAAWAGVLVAILGLFLTIILAGHTAMAWFIRLSIRSAIADLKRELEGKIEGAVTDAAAARQNSDATLHNQVMWMEHTNGIDQSQIIRPTDHP